MKIEIGINYYKTRDGHRVRINKTDGGGRYPIRGDIFVAEGWHPAEWMTDGKFTTSIEEDEWDIVSLWLEEPRASGIVEVINNALSSFVKSGYSTPESITLKSNDYQELYADLCSNTSRLAGGVYTAPESFTFYSMHGTLEVQQSRDKLQFNKDYVAKNVVANSPLGICLSCRECTKLVVYGDTDGHGLCSECAAA